MSSHKEKTKQQTQEAMYRNKKCRNQNKGEAQIICCNGRGEFHVPPTTTTYRCPRCQAITASSSRNGQSNKDSGNEMGKKRYRIKGSVNDVANMRELLVKIFDFPTEGVHELTEDKQSENFYPTKKNILRELEWLVEGCQKGDSLVFYFSGHGIQQTNSKEDEIDAMDESICPVDFLHEGMILDNEMNSKLVWPLVEGVTLHVIADTCHSGTVLDLSYVYDPEKCTWKDNKPPSKGPSRKHPSRGRQFVLVLVKIIRWLLILQLSEGRE
ncbi:hypothetical protein K1719_008644 [Acacia pycnantha]|nr:hypothetical protein K1719_008644 [Acacia pycnantha]